MTILDKMHDDENRRKDAQTYLDKINSLGFGSYSLADDGSRFPEYVSIKRTDSSSDRKTELPVLELSGSEYPIFCARIDEMVKQLQPQIEKGEADFFVQQLKII